MSSVRGEDGWDDNYYVTELCEPRKLRPQYFARGGAIVVGVSRRMNNPLRFFYSSDSEEGIFRSFSLNNRNRFMWTAAAAIAGFNWNSPAESFGQYDPTFWEASLEEVQNLKYSDWDALLLPLHRAWAEGINLVWTGETGGEILNEVRNGTWEAVFGGSGALGEQGAPELMNEGAEVNYLAAEGLINH
jgi:hypothetical protein